MGITIKSVLRQLVSDVTADEPQEELAKTGKFFQRVFHNAAKEAEAETGALRLPEHDTLPPDEATDPGMEVPPVEVVNNG